MPEELPKGWISTTLGEIRHNKSTYISRNQMRGEIFELYSVPAFSEGKPQIVSGDEIGSNKNLVSPGDVLLCKINPRINRAWVVGKLRDYRQIASTEWIVFSKQSGISSDFLRYFLSQETFREYLARNVSGVGGSLMRVRPSIVEAYPFTLPPTDEQMRIVAKLNASFSRLARAEKAAHRARERLQHYISAVLNSAVTGKLTRKWRKSNSDYITAYPLRNRKTGNFDLPPTWNCLHSSEVFKYVTSGSRDWARYYANEGALFIRIGNMRNDSINLDLSSIQRVSPPKNAEGRRTRVVKGDILISITADIGKVALVETDLGEAYINQHIALVRLVDNIDSRYVAYFLCAKNGGRDQFLKLKHGATKVGLGLNDIKNVWIPCPPLAEQKEIVREIEGRLSAANSLAITLEQQISRTHVTRQTLLKEAFSGHLVSQDPKNEAAAVILERIREVSKSKAKKPKGMNNMSNRKSKSKLLRRSLLDVLRENKKPITPEQLFILSGFQQEFKNSECRHEIVDSFYEELRQLISPKGPIVQLCPDKDTVLLELKK